MKSLLRMFPGPAVAWTMALAVALAGGWVGTAGAQAVSAADPPGRVARLADAIGQVWLYSPEAGEWVSAVRNQPLTTGDRLATDTGARAEMQVGSSTVRLDGGTELEVLALDDDHVALQLHSGSVSARLREATEATGFELATDEGRFVVQRTGRYRFDRDGSGTFATVYAGQARYEGPNSGLAIPVGRRAEFWIDASGAAQYRLDDLQSDAFAAWNDERDRLADRSVSARYVSPAMTGAEELDRYGRWEQDPEYGALWIPRGVAVDWAPYSTGHWAWVRPWGWTWIDDAPWGFAPFHYGRWVHLRNTWCWTPGQRVVRPIYAPALVGWVGGPGVSVSISIGGRPPPPVVGWFPLAPREVYVPSYRVSPRYAQNINITHVTNVTQINTVINNPQAPREFDNRRVQHAVTVVPAAVMTTRQPVAPAAAQLRDAPWVRDIAKQPARAAALVVAPVTAPAAPPTRNPESRPVAPAPGAVALPGRPAPVARPPGAPPRERDGVRPAPSAAAPATAVAPPVPALPSTPVVPGARAPQEPVTRGSPPAQPLPQPQATTPLRPVPRDGRDRPSTPVAPAVAPVAPAPRPVVPQAAPTVAPPVAQEAPTMRPLPVQRGDERRQAPRTEAPVVVAPPRPPAPVERPVPPARPAEPARAVVPAAPVTVAPAAPSTSPGEAKRVEPAPHPRGEPAKEVREDKRDDKRDDKRP